jgi:hypothetical protein
MRKSSPLLVSPAVMTGLTVVIAIILLASNFTIIKAQTQQLTSQPGEIEDRRTAVATATTTAVGRTFQSANDSFSIQVPDGWIIHDFNNTGFTSLEELRQGYVMLAQLCPEEEQQRILSNVGGSTDSGSSTSIGNGCQGAKEVIHIIRYPDLNARLLANNISTINNNMTTTDNILLSYHLQKLQEVGYRDIEIVNSIERTVNLTNAQTNQTIQTMPAKFVETIYSTASAPNEIRDGYFILTATNATAPNIGVTKGYSVFYEGGSSVAAGRTTTAAPEITTASGSLIPSLTPPVDQVFDSFELIAAPGVEQPIAQQTQAAEATITTEDEGDDVGDGDDEEDDEEDDEDEDEGRDNSCHPSYPDVCIPPPPPDLNCDDIDARNFEVSGSDPHGFDGNDNDGIGCESGSSAPDDLGDDVDDGDDNGADDDEDGNEGGIEEGQGSQGVEPGGELSPGTPPEGGELQPPETGEEGQPPGGELSPGTPSPTTDNGEAISPSEEGQGSGEGQSSGEGEPGGELSPGTPSPTTDNGEAISPSEEGQGSENEFEDCIVRPGMDPSDVGC